ncbi:MAG: NADH-quinone oxidoreductase subunit L [Elusimicrobia bacterium]|nr:NADH-quinone oxidoreductase subunit L [Elusimicrobiota bacterium]
MTPPEVMLAVKVLFGAPVAAILFGFFVMRRVKPEWTHLPILASCAAVTAAAACLAAYTTAKHCLELPVWTWAVAGDWGVAFGLRIDGPSSAILAMVAFVGSLIHVYAAAYMKGDKGFARFFLVFHLFFLAMIGLLTANDYLQLYLFWELVGVSSYLLIGFWYHKESARKAALKAFMTNRIGDLGFLIAVLMMIYAYRSTRLQTVYEFMAAKPSIYTSIIALGLVWAAFAKSAQWPLYYWLPDAMEGPTPTSALMHAATMVTAGVFLLIRSWPIISAVDGLPQLIAWTGALTSLGAAIIAGTKKDIKRILAYSTVSHLGLMMLAVGLGELGTAAYHLIVHGFFKAALFLCAGNIAHAFHQSTANVDETGGLRREMPFTYGCFLAAALSLAGAPLFAGFFSKDAILDAAWHHGGGLRVIGMLIAFGSAFYIFRMLFLVFHGDRKEQSRGGRHPHEAGPEFVLPIFALSFGAVVLGHGSIREWVSNLMTYGMRGVPMVLIRLKPYFDLPGEPALPALNWTVSAFGTVLALLGAGAAYYLTMVDSGWDWRWRGGFAEAVFESDFGYKIIVGWGARAVSWTARFTGRVLDKNWWDGLLESSSDVLREAGNALASSAQGRVNDYLWWMLAGSAVLLGRVLR